MIRPGKSTPRQSIPSPLDVSSLFSEFNQLQRLRKDIEASHQLYLDKLDEKIANATAAIEHAKTIQKGEPGFTPVKGVHYHDGAQGPAGKDGQTPVINHREIAKQLLPLLPKVKDGKDGKAPTLDEILKAVKEKLTVEHIPGLKGEIDSYRNQLAGKIYGKDTLIRGGGDTVTAGTNVTITTDTNGKKVIAASASGSTILVATGTVNNSNTAFTFVSKPTMVVVNGSNYRENHGWSWNAGTLTVTLDNPVGTGGDIYGLS